jgi:dihydrofolate synthase/folylpolyglutamate synthase
MYQRQGQTAFKKDLTNSIALVNHLNNPHLKFKSVHIAGTNGKGSVSHITASVLQEAGYKVGLYTSPHLKDFRERIKLNGKKISKNFVQKFINENIKFLERQKLSFFEMTVGLAFYYFAEQEVDIAVIEVGLGGRLDSTNIISPEVSVITNIGYDHTQFLGESLTEIAYEKSGIIKDNIPVVIGENQSEIKAAFESRALFRNSKLWFAEDQVKNNYKSDLIGDYQQKNIKTAVQTIHVLKSKEFNISEKNIKKGLKNVVVNTGLMGRWQILGENPKIICDTAHNKEGLTYVLKQLAKENCSKLHIVLGFVNDKNLSKILPLFPTNAKYYFCKPNIPRGLDEHILQKAAFENQLFGDCFESVKFAMDKAKLNAKEEDLIFIGGSTFVVAEVV